MSPHPIYGASALPPESACAEPDDLALVRAALAGDVPSREALLRQISCVAKFLRAMNQRYGGPLDTHELEDVVQDTLLVLWRKLDSFQGLGSLSGWVLGVAKLEFLQAVRKRSRRSAPPATSDVTELDGGHRDPAQAAVDRETLVQVLATLDAASEATIRLKHYSGLTFEEIGRRLQCNANTAKTRYYLGMTKLARALGKSVP